MYKFERQHSQLKKYVETARAINLNQIDIIEGCRLLISLWIEIGLEKNDDYYFFIAIDSETEMFPKGAIRKNFSKEYLQKMDEEEEYLQKIGENIQKICEGLTDKYSI